MCTQDVWMPWLWLFDMENQIFFVIMTCNPYWDEIVKQLLPGQMPQDRPDIVARVYRAKL